MIQTISIAGEVFRDGNLGCVPAPSSNRADAECKLAGWTPAGCCTDVLPKPPASPLNWHGSASHPAPSHRSQWPLPVFPSCFPPHSGRAGSGVWPLARRTRSRQSTIRWLVYKLYVSLLYVAGGSCSVWRWKNFPDGRQYLSGSHMGETTCETVGFTCRLIGMNSSSKCLL